MHLEGKGSKQRPRTRKEDGKRSRAPGSCLGLTSSLGPRSLPICGCRYNGHYSLLCSESEAQGREARKNEEKRTAWLIIGSIVEAYTYQPIYGRRDYWNRITVGNFCF